MGLGACFPRRLPCFFICLKMSAEPAKRDSRTNILRDDQLEVSGYFPWCSRSSPSFPKCQAIVLKSRYRFKKSTHHNS
jgi:hypothetical protein